MLILALLLFVAVFAIAPSVVRAVKNSGGEFVAAAAVIAAALWVLGFLLQLLKYGTVTAPCCQ